MGLLGMAEGSVDCITIEHIQQQTHPGGSRADTTLTELGMWGWAGKGIKVVQVQHQGTEGIGNPSG